MSRLRYIIALSSILVLGAPAVHASTGTSWSLTAVGDIMLDRYVWTLMQRNGTDYPFRDISSTLRGANVVLGNLEGPFTPGLQHAVAGGSLSFNFSPSLAPVLRQSGLTTLSLANNHTLNQGQRGLESTREVLHRSGLEYFGDPRNFTNYHLTKTINGRRITFLGYDALDGRIDTVLSDITNAHRKDEYVIIMAHWGTEYRLGMQSQPQYQAKQLIDAGADLVLGSHPHVVEPFEIYKGKFIAYSLGNFVFDQYFSADVQQGLLLNIHFGPTSLNIQSVPLVSIRSKVMVASGTTKTSLLRRLANQSVVSNKVRQDILSGSITLPL